MSERTSEASVAQVLFGLDSVAVNPIAVEPPTLRKKVKKEKTPKKPKVNPTENRADDGLVSDDSHSDREEAAKVKCDKELEPKQEENNPDAEAKRLRKEKRKKLKAFLKKRNSDDEMSRTLAVTNVPVQMKRKGLQAAIGIPADELVSIRFRNVPLKAEYREKRKIGSLQRKFATDGRGMTAFVVLKSTENISKYLALTGKELESGRHIFIDRLRQPNEFSMFDRRNTVFVGRLPKNYLEENLYKTFKVYGSIANVRIVRDSATGESKCFGYVCFQNRATVDEALRGAKNRQVDGHSLRVMRCLKEIDMKTKLAEKRAREREQLERRKEKLAEEFDMANLSKSQRRKLIRYGMAAGRKVGEGTLGNGGAKVKKQDSKAEMRRRTASSSNSKVLTDLKRNAARR